MSDFIDFARAHGIEINAAQFTPSQRIKRCPTTDKPRSKNGAFFFDGTRGWVFNWSGDASVHWWNDPNARPWTEAEKHAWKVKREAAKSNQAREYQQAALRAEQLLSESELKPHDYLHLKGFPALEGMVVAGDLLVPMRNCITNKIQGLQRIHWDGEARQWTKKMFPGMQARNAVLRLGPKTAQETIFCEGYATGLSVEIAARQMRLGAAVMVCFSDRNMVNVAGQIKGRKYAYADNDKSGAGERAAIDAGLPYCMSDTVGFDANDDHQKHGLMTVCKKLMDLRRRC